MPKPTRGLPASFTLDVPEEVLRGPVQLGDYLDEQDISPPIVARTPASSPSTPQRPPQTRTEPAPVRQFPPPQRPIAVVSEPIPQPDEPPPPPLNTFGRRVSRKQLNLNPETLRMVDELLHHIQTKSVQKDAKASEMFHALVAALYDARESLSLADVPPRGRWGTPTAFAFPVALKGAFQTAIAQWFARYGR